MNSLIIAAHPDDEVLGCGGLIALRAAAGDNVSVLVLGEGITSRKNLDTAHVKQQLERLHSQCDKAGKFLGARRVVNCDFPDNRFDSVALLEIVHAIETVVDSIKPQEVFVQHGGDLNIDHQITFKAAMTAVRPMADSPVMSLYAYEVASSTEWSFQRFSPVFRPSMFVDISSVLDIKIEAMAMYEGERRPFPHPRSEKAILAQAVKWGTTVGFGAAEAFEVIFEKVNFHD